MTQASTTEASAELALARDTLEAARLLARAGFHRHAVGRAYYAVFHAACALLASIGRTSRTHEGVRALVNEHFVRPGVLGAEHARVLRQTAADRTDADYDTSATFNAEDSANDVSRAAAFIEAVEGIVAPAVG